MTTWINAILVGLGALVMLVTAASALEDEVKEICQPAIAAYCTEAQIDDDALRQCLEENQDVVSAQCRQALDESKES